MDISSIGHAELARLMLRSLFRCYDAGGHSMGRSERSQLLEAALALLPPPVDGELPWAALEAEYRKRINVLPRQLLLPFDQFPIFLMNSEELAIQLLLALEDWYARNGYDEFGEVYTFERTTVEAILDLMDGTHQMLQAEAEELKEECAKRRYCLYRLVW